MQDVHVNTQCLVKRKELGQYMSNEDISLIMSSAFERYNSSERVLDAGAGAGMLSGAFIDSMLKKNKRADLNITAYEIDKDMIQFLKAAKELCIQEVSGTNISLEFNIINRDFISEAVECIKEGVIDQYDKVIINPPYKKISVNGAENLALNSIGIRSSNLYSSFVMLSIALLRTDGELVAILPRSFCNGVYFKEFRQYILERCSLEKIYTFDSRNKLFKGVLQENIIIHLKKTKNQSRHVKVYSYQADNLKKPEVYQCPINDIIPPNNPSRFIHIISSKVELLLSRKISQLKSSLDSLELNISTGQIVGFRNKHAISKGENGVNADLIPLLIPANIHSYFIQDLGFKQPLINKKTISEKDVNKMGYYVLIRRISSRDEKRRLVAAVLEPTVFSNNAIAFDNKLNFIHARRNPLTQDLAIGLCAYLSSTPVDLFFRQMNGHTQVNAADLRVLRYPNRFKLKELGKKIKLMGEEIVQEQIDKCVSQVVFGDY